MAETWCKAFGRYLRTLRQRRGLSLQEVCSLSQAFAELVDKGYLSRCENGKQGPAFAKIIPLSRIYEVPADVLLERLELDMELDRVGGPDTEGVSFAELTAAGSVAIDQGFFWRSYALLRDALQKAATDDVKQTFRDQQEQVAVSHMNCATAARALGRHRFALHEYTVLDNSEALGPRNRLIVWDRMSVIYRSFKELRRAKEYADRAVCLAEELGEARGLGLTLSNRGRIAFEESDLPAARNYFQRAYSAFQDAGWEPACARSLNNLAQVYFDLSRLRAARRAVVAAEKLASRLGQPRTQALTRILMGEIDQREERGDSASKHWKKAGEIARELDDKVLRFKAEFFLFRQAQERGNDGTARSLLRRLRKLAHWVPEDTPELSDFRRLQPRAS